MGFNFTFRLFAYIFNVSFDTKMDRYISEDEQLLLQVKTQLQAKQHRQDDDEEAIGVTSLSKNKIGF